MKNFSIRALLIVTLLAGIGCWFLLVPVKLSVPVGSYDGNDHEAGERLLFCRFDPEFKPPKNVPPMRGKTQHEATFVSINGDKTEATIAMSRMDYFRFDYASGPWNVTDSSGKTIWKYVP